MAMATDSTHSTASFRDGTSQATRQLAALQPTFARVEERSLPDLLAFAQAFARELAYYDGEDAERPQGDWSQLLAGAADLERAGAFVGDPASVSAADAATFSRPHVALLLVVLQLIEGTRARANDLTRRHLEYFYRDVLRMTRKPAVPDLVHVLVTPDVQVDRLALPAGTSLLAGRDSTGVDLQYRTTGELIASRASIADIRSVHAEIRVAGVEEASRRYLTAGTRNEAFLAMLRMALGEPRPGDPLPVPIYLNVPPPKSAPSQPEPAVTFDVLMQVAALLRVLPEQLWMPSFDDFRLLMRLTAQRATGDAGDWGVINGILAKAARTRDRNAAFSTPQPMAFLTNLQAAIGVSARDYAHLYDGLPEVKSIEDAYEVYGRRPDVAAFVPARLFLSLDDFRTLMQTRVRMEGEWNEIDRLFDEAGQRRRNDVTFRLPADVRAARAIAPKLAAAVGTPDLRGAGSLDGYFSALQAVERYFFMSAEQVAFLLETAGGGTPPDRDAREWVTVYDIVTAAHREKIYAGRRAELVALAAADVTAGRTARALAVAASAAIETPSFDGGDPAGFLTNVWPRLQSFGVNVTELTYLQHAVALPSSSVDWPRVMAALEIAQRNREALPPPVPRTTEWRNLYPAADARLVVSGSPAGPTSAGPRRWRTFGPREEARAPEPTPAPSFGWALTSPLLTLSEGARSVDVTLGVSPDLDRFDRRRLLAAFKPADAAGLTASENPFVVTVSTADGWDEPSAVTLMWANPQMTGYPAVAGVDTSKLAALTFRLSFTEDRPPLATPTLAVHGLLAPAPVVRFLLRPIWVPADRAYVTAYEALRALTIQRVRVTVGVQGLKTLTLRNDQTILDAKQPFEPFGSTPSAGARLYLGHPELVSKRLDSIVVRAAWKGVPPTLNTHYANYPLAPANKAYTARVALVDRGLQRDFTTPLALFDPADATVAVTRTLAPPADQGRCDDTDTRSADVSEWNRHLVWELGAPDFQHATYPPLALQKSLELAAAVANQTPKPLNPAAYQVNAPVTPAIKSLRLDYTASAEQAFDRGLPDAALVRVFHIEPFGYAELVPQGPEPGSWLLPQYDDEGELYIGLRDVSAPQRVSLLFQMAEGSADPDLVPEPVCWSVLSGNRWVTLHDGSLLADGTHGFINSGIVELQLTPVQPSTRLPGDLYWLRASVSRSAASVCDTVDVHVNAVQAVFADQGNAPAHLMQPLPAYSITETLEPLTGVAEIRQPYSSFGGKMAEQDASFYVRVSERLRHRERALTPWDYERLVLEKFQRLYKVKCLRADQQAQPRSPGRIDLVVIPDIRSRMPFDPFEPKAPADLLRDIDVFLQDKIPPSARVAVRNARYIPVKVRCGVRFATGHDDSYCRRQLNDDLNRFLSPWAYDEGADVIIGGRVYANSIIDFLERRDYVDYVAEFKLFTSDDNGQTFTHVAETDDYHAGVPGPDCVLVAARQHQFDVIGQADYRVEVFYGINYMQIGLDFVVS